METNAENGALTNEILEERAKIQKNIDRLKVELKKNRLLLNALNETLKYKQKLENE